MKENFIPLQWYEIRYFLHYSNLGSSEYFSCWQIELKSFCEMLSFLEIIYYFEKKKERIELYGRIQWLNFM